MKPKTVSIQLSASRMKRIQRFAKENCLSVAEFLRSALDSVSFDEFLEESSDRQSAKLRKHERGSGLTIEQMKRKYLGRRKKSTALEKQLAEDYKSIRYTKEDRDFLNAPSLYLEAPEPQKKSATSRRKKK